MPVQAITFTKPPWIASPSHLVSGNYNSGQPSLTGESTGVSYYCDVDLTNVPELLVTAMRALSGYNWGLKILIDGNLVYEVPTKSEYGEEICVVPLSYTGVHTLTFRADPGIFVNLKRFSLLKFVPPTVKFSTSLQSDKKTVKFTDSSTETPDSWFWDFGDGQTSTEQNPTHTYATPGSYTVTLTATNSYGDSQTVKDIRIPAAPIANFNFIPAGGLGISFTDMSANNPTGWAWDFGEIENKTEQNPTHIYQKPGTYNVTLTATNVDGNGSKTISVPVTVTAPAKPVADFSVVVPDGSSPLSLQFTDQSTNNPTSWLWNFGDGQTSTEQNPVHAYTTTGLYTATLIATNINGSTTVSKSVNVQSGTAPAAKYMVTPGTITAGTKARITISGQNFVSGSKIRIVKPMFWGTVSQVVSFTDDEIIFDFVFGVEYSGVCGIALISSKGTVLIEGAITVV